MWKLSSAPGMNILGNHTNDIYVSMSDTKFLSFILTVLIRVMYDLFTASKNHK